MAFKEVLLKADLPTATAYTDAANTFSQAQVFSAAVTVPTPTASGHPTTKSYVDTAVASGGIQTIYVQSSDFTPTNIAQGVVTGFDQFTLNWSDLPVGKTLFVEYAGKIEAGAPNGGYPDFRLKMGGTDVIATPIFTRIQSVNVPLITLFWQLRLVFNRRANFNDGMDDYIAHSSSFTAVGRTQFGDSVDETATNTHSGTTSLLASTVSSTVRLHIRVANGSVGSTPTVYHYQTVAYVI